MATASTAESLTENSNVTFIRHIVQYVFQLAGNTCHHHRTQVESALLAFLRGEVTPVEFKARLPEELQQFAVDIPGVIPTFIKAHGLEESLCEAVTSICQAMNES
jgi:hypothetical protein